MTTNEVIEYLKGRIKNLPIYCRVCGEKLSLSSSGPNTPSWGCSGYEEDDTDGPLKMKEGRRVADQHYSDSRYHMEFDSFKYYENLEKEFREIIKIARRGQ